MLGKCLTSPRNMTISQYPTTVKKTQDINNNHAHGTELCLTHPAETVGKRNKKKY